MITANNIPDDIAVFEAELLIIIDNINTIIMNIKCLTITLYVDIIDEVNVAIINIPIA